VTVMAYAQIAEYRAKRMKRNDQSDK